MMQADNVAPGPTIAAPGQWTHYVVEQFLGATRGGSAFTVMREDREIELDGTRGPIKGLKRTIMHTATLAVTLIELSEQTWLDITRGTATAGTKHNIIVPDNAILSSDYYDTIALVAEVQNAEENAMGTDADRGACIILLKNAMIDGEVSSLD